MISNQSTLTLQMKIPARQEDYFFPADIHPDKLDNERIASLSDDNNSRPSSPSPQSSWGFIRKLFRENKPSGVVKALDSPTDSPNIPRKLRRASLGDRGISTKNTHIISHKKENTAAEKAIIKQRKTSFGSARRKFSGTHSTENLLHYAVAEKDMATLNKLFQNAVIDINYMRTPGVSPLHLACIAGHLCVITLLTENGADLKLKTWSGLTALQIANMFGHFEVAQYLISQGADYRDVQNGVADSRLMLGKP